MTASVVPLITEHQHHLRGTTPTAACACVLMVVIEKAHTHRACLPWGIQAPMGASLLASCVCACVCVCVCVCVCGQPIIRVLVASVTSHSQL